MKFVPLLFVTLLLAGCASTFEREDDVSSDLRARHHIGRTFVTTEDLYIYQLKHDERPQLAAPRGSTGPVMASLPSPVSRKAIGYSSSILQIVDVLPAGAILRVERIVAARTFKSDWINIILADDTAGGRRLMYQLSGGLELLESSYFREEPSFFKSYTRETMPIHHAGPQK